MGDLFLLAYIFSVPYLLACMMRKVVAGKFPSTECPWVESDSTL